MQKLLVFDLDGTLIDSSDDLAHSVNLIRHQLGLPTFKKEKIRSFIGNGIAKLVERSFADAKVDLSYILDRYREVYYENAVNKTFLYPDVFEGLKQLTQSGFINTVLTNKPGDVSRKILDKLSIIPFFHSVIGAEDGYKLKPDTEGLKYLISRFNIDNQSCWMIGDHHTDLIAGNDANVKTGFVTYGFGNMNHTKPTEQFASFSDLVEYFLHT